MSTGIKAGGLSRKGQSSIPRNGYSEWRGGAYGMQPMVRSRVGKIDLGNGAQFLVVRDGTGRISSNLEFACQEEKEKMMGTIDQRGQNFSSSEKVTSPAGVPICVFGKT